MGVANLSKVMLMATSKIKTETSLEVCLLPREVYGGW